MQLQNWMFRHTKVFNNNSTVLIFLIPPNTIDKLFGTLIKLTIAYYNIVVTILVAQNLVQPSAILSTKFIFQTTEIP